MASDANPRRSLALGRDDHAHQRALTSVEVWFFSRIKHQTRTALTAIVRILAPMVRVFPNFFSDKLDRGRFNADVKGVFMPTTKSGNVRRPICQGFPVSLGGRKQSAYDSNLELQRCAIDQDSY